MYKYCGFISEMYMHLVGWTLSIQSVLWTLIKRFSIINSSSGGRAHEQNILVSRSHETVFIGHATYRHSRISYVQLRPPNCFYKFFKYFLKSFFFCFFCPSGAYDDFICELVFFTNAQTSPRIKSNLMQKTEQKVMKIIKKPFPIQTSRFNNIFDSSFASNECQWNYKKHQIFRT